jgi:hypothetical protein
VYHYHSCGRHARVKQRSTQELTSCYEQRLVGQGASAASETKRVLERQWDRLMAHAHHDASVRHTADSGGTVARLMSEGKVSVGSHASHIVVVYSYDYAFARTRQSEHGIIVQLVGVEAVSGASELSDIAQRDHPVKGLSITLHVLAPSFAVR